MPTVVVTRMPLGAIYVVAQDHASSTLIRAACHALLEGIPGHMTWGCYMTIPPPIVQRMDVVYQAVLAAACPAARDAATLQRARVAAAMRWSIFHVLARVPVALEADRLRGETTLRQQLMAWLEASACMAEEADYLCSLGTSARTLASASAQSVVVFGHPATAVSRVSVARLLHRMTFRRIPGGVRADVA